MKTKILALAMVGLISSAAIGQTDSATVPQPRGNVRDFLRAVAHLESEGNQRAVNRWGYLGLYQFSPRTLRLLGFRASRRTFLGDRDMQDRAMLRYMRDNERGLQDIIRRYAGTTHRGVYITRSGILASAHFGGSNGVRRWFRGARLRDQRGTPMTLYMSRFGNYDLGEL